MLTPVTRLVLFLILSAALIVPFGKGLLRAYIEQADPDIVFAYQALQLNDGDSRINAEHTGYAYFLILAFVLRLAAALGFIDIARLSPLQILSPAEFDAAYTGVIVVGRTLSITLSILLVLVMFTAARVVTRTTIGGLIAAALTAISWGTATQSILLRTEILSAIFVMCALKATVLAARATDSQNILWMIAAGLSAALAVATKLQTIVPLLAVAALAVALGERPQPYAGALSPTERKYLVGLWSAIASTAALAAAVMLVSGMVERGSTGLYQSVIVLYLVSCLLIFGVVYRPSLLRFVAGFSALLFGFSVGVLLHLLYPNPPATDAIGAFVEHMKVYTPAAGEEAPAPYQALFSLAIRSANATFQSHFGRIAFARNPSRVVEFLIIGAIISNTFLGNRREAFLSALFLATSYTVEIWSRLRGLPLHYLVYIDTWVALAGATAASPILLRLCRSWLGGAVATAAFLVLAFAQISAALSPHFIAVQERANACYQAQTYMPLLAAQFQKFCP